MKVLKAIVLTELQLLFFSPVAWLVLIIFTVLTGSNLAGHLQAIAGRTALGYHQQQNETFVLFTEMVFSQSLFPVLKSQLFFYVPLLTMGMFSREYDTGSIKLLESSPIKTEQVVIGKFLSMVIFGLLIMAVIFTAVLTANLFLTGLDNRWLLLCLLGIYLLFCAYCAIGLFVSSLTRYQMVAALATFAILALLDQLQDVGQELEFTRQLTYTLSISGRTESFITGLLNSRDLLYFILIIILFLGLLIINMNNRRGALPRYRQVFRLAAFSILMVFFGWISGLTPLIGYLDMTAAKRNSLDATNVAILKAIKGDVDLTAYANIMDENGFIGLPNYRNTDRKFWEPYLRYLPGLNFRYVEYYDSVSATGADTPELSAKALRRAVTYDYPFNNLLPPLVIRREPADLSAEGYHTVRRISSENGAAWLRLFKGMDAGPHESEIMAAFKQLLVPAPKVAFLSGHAERPFTGQTDRDYGMVAGERDTRSAMINLGFNVFSRNVDSILKMKDLSLLVISDPVRAFSSGEQKTLRQYIARGGNLLVTTSPASKNILNPVVASLGANFLPGTIVQQSSNRLPDEVMADCDFNGQSNLSVILKDAVPAVFIQGTAGFRPYVAIASNPVNSWDKKDKFDLFAGMPSFAVQRGDLRGPFSLGVALTRQTGGREQRIFLLGSADLLSNHELFKAQNYLFARQLFKWFAYGQYPLEDHPVKQEVNHSSLSLNDLFLIKLLFFAVIPGMMFFTGSIIIFIRTKR